MRQRRGTRPPALFCVGFVSLNGVIFKYANKAKYVLEMPFCLTLGIHIIWWFIRLEKAVSNALGNMLSSSNARDNVILKDTRSCEM